MSLGARFIAGLIGLGALCGSTAVAGLELLIF